MFSAFNTTAKLYHVTTLPPGATFSAALAKLHDHDALIHLDPELVSYEPLPDDPSLSPGTKRYKVTDHMQALPKGLWDSTITFESQITDTEDGIIWVVKAPLGLVQRTTWRLLKGEGVQNSGVGGEVAADKDGEDDVEGKGQSTGWSLVEDMEIRASRLLVGTVKAKCEEGWKVIHGNFVKLLEK